VVIKFIGDTGLEDKRGSAYRAGMARPKRLTIETTLRLDAASVERIDHLISDEENRATFIRGAIELALALREAEIPGTAKNYLFANETMNQFFVNAIMRAIDGRRSVMATETSPVQHQKTK